MKKALDNVLRDVDKGIVGEPFEYTVRDIIQGIRYFNNIELY